jgi:hypothetical protein
MTMADQPPPQVAAAARIVEQWLTTQQPPTRKSADEFARMSFAERLDYARGFPQPLESGLRR